MEKNQDIILIDTLFNEQKKYHEVWKSYENLYLAIYSNDYYQQLKAKKRSRIFVPVVRNTVNIITAIFSTAFFSKGNPIELIATNESEKELIAYRNKVLNYKYDKLKPSVELLKAFTSSLVFGMGIVITYYDDVKKKVITTHVPVSDLAFDPECTSIDDIEVLAYKKYESNRVTLEKIESGFYNQKDIKARLYQGEEPKSYERNEVKILFSKKGNNEWEIKEFIRDVEVRVKTFKSNPFQYGNAIPMLPRFEPEYRQNQILCYGDTVPNFLKEIQQEINYKRNVKNDIQEKNLNPDVYVGDKTKVDPSDLTYGAGRRIQVRGDVNQIKERTVPSEYALNTDLGMLAGDVQSAVGVNSIQEGQTGASDRRSANAMAVINSNSSMRIEQMIILIKETLFEHWAKRWVELVMANVTDEEIHKITGRDDFPLGAIGDRDEIEYDLKINFGMTLDKQQKINEKLQAFQIASQNPNIKPEIIEGLLKDLLTLIVGDDTNIQDLFEKNTDDMVDHQPTEEEIQELQEIENLTGGGI